MTLLLFLLILSVLVFVHELGHFIAARKAGIKVEEFGFGLPFTKPIFSAKKRETIYSIYPLFFGGFVKLYGEDGSEGGSEIATNVIPAKAGIYKNNKERLYGFPIKSGMTENLKGGAFFEKSILRRLSVLLAGVSMNLILGIVCFSILYFIWGIPTKTGKVMVEAITESSPAKSAGLQPLDQIVTVDGLMIKEGDTLVKIAKEKAGKEINLEIKRGENQVLVLSIVPRENPPAGEGPLGVIITDTDFKKYPWYQMPYLGIREGFKESISWGKMVLLSLKTMVVSVVLRGQVPKEVAGPIGIYQITGQAAKAGWMAVLQFVGILSVNLAIMNILPLPALDGGRIIFLGYEAIFRKKANPKVELWVNQIGMMILLGLMALITVNDVLRLIRK